MSTTTMARTTCKYPDCGQPAAPAGGTGRLPEYCASRLEGSRTVIKTQVKLARQSFTRDGCGNGPRVVRAYCKQSAQTGV